MEEKQETRVTDEQGNSFSEMLDKNPILREKLMELHREDFNVVRLLDLGLKHLAGEEETETLDPVRNQFQGCLCGPAREKLYVLKCLVDANVGNDAGYFNSALMTGGIVWMLDEAMWTMEQADLYIEELQAQVKAAGNGGAS